MFLSRRPSLNDEDIYNIFKHFSQYLRFLSIRRRCKNKKNEIFSYYAITSGTSQFYKNIKPKKNKQKKKRKIK